MWTLKIKFLEEKFLLSKAAQEFNLVLTGYVLYVKKERDKILVSAAGMVFGDEKNKKRFIKYLKKSKNVIQFETRGDFIILLVREPIENHMLYNPNIIHIKPVIVEPDGWETWEVASWNRKELIKLLNFIKINFNYELLKLRKEKINNVTVTTVYPELTEKQKKALEIAIRNGYYTYPKKIKLVELAKIMKISFSTYQEHLKKAEAKIISFAFGRLR